MLLTAVLGASHPATAQMGVGSTPPVVGPPGVGFTPPVVGPPIEPPQTGITLVPFLTVFDALGRKVGQIANSIESIVSFQVNGRLFSITVEPQRFATGIFLQYKAADCTSAPAFIDPDTDSNSILPRPALAGPGTTAYLPELGGFLQLVTVKSGFDQSTRSCVNFLPGTLLLAIAVAVVNLDTFFTPPFTAR